MRGFFIVKKKNPAYRYISRLSVCLLTLSLVFSPVASYAQSVLNLPTPGTMVFSSPSFNPAIIKGITIHPSDPFLFDFIIHPGDEHLKGDDLTNESNKLIKYFMAALTVPEDEMWVNLSPYEKDRIIPKGFGNTEMGRDLLAQDYMLKQLTASLMYPEDELGNDFWNRVYEKVQEKYGSTEIPMNTFNKVWIVPEKAVLYENGTSAFIVESRLKVMLEEDYLVLESNLGRDKHGLGDISKDDLTRISEVSSEIIKEIIIPEIEKEVNEGKTFANLRQIFNSVILATWYKQSVQGSILEQIYINQNKTEGIDTEDKEINQKIYSQYVEAFKKGVYNFIKEDYDLATQEVIPRKYFSGGANLKTQISNTTDTARPGEDLKASSSVRMRMRNTKNGEAMLSDSEVNRMLELSKLDYYSRLGIDRDADIRTIKKAYKKLILKWHPDQNRDAPGELQKSITNIAINLTEAWEILKDERKRKIYDRDASSRGATGDFADFKDFKSKFSPEDFEMNFGLRDLEDILDDLAAQSSLNALKEIEEKIQKSADWHTIDSSSIMEIKAFIAAIKQIKDGFTRSLAIDTLGRVAQEEVVTYSDGMINQKRRVGYNKNGIQGDTPQLIATKGLVEILETDENDSVLIICVQTLYSVANPIAIKGLIKSLNHQQKRIRNTIKEALITIGNNANTSEVTVALLNKSLSLEDKLIQGSIREILAKIDKKYKKPFVDLSLREKAIERIINDLIVEEDKFQSFEKTFIYAGSLDISITMLAAPFSDQEFNEALKIIKELADAYSLLVVKVQSGEGSIVKIGLHTMGIDEKEYHQEFLGKIKAWLNMAHGSTIPSSKPDSQEKDADGIAGAVLGFEISSSPSQVPGGIDLNPQNISIQTRGDGTKIQFPLFDQSLPVNATDGFVPVIINITPITNIPLLLGVESESLKEQQLTRL